MSRYGRSAFQNCKKAELALGGQTIQAAVSVCPLNGMLITLPREAEPPLGEPLEIVFYDPVQGVVTCNVALYSPLVEEDHRHCSYRCNILEQLSSDQRRQDIKVPISATVTVCLQGDEMQEGRPADLWNLSAGGVYLTTALRAQVGQYFSFTFLCDGHEVPLTAEVLRVEDRTTRPQQPLYGYGCRFIGLSQRQESILRGYVFAEDRRLRKP